MYVLYFTVFFFNATATTEIYTLSLHDALPIFGERLVRLDEGDAADVARIRYGIGVRRGVGRHVGDPEPPVTGETVLEQLAVARLEDVQGLGGPGKKDIRQREEGELGAHGYIVYRQGA